MKMEKLLICYKCDYYNSKLEKCSKIKCKRCYNDIINSQLGKCPIKKF